MGVELVIERCGLAITASAVQGLRLLERAVGVQPQDMQRIFPGLFLQCLQNTSPEGGRPIVWPSASLEQDALGLSETQAETAQPLPDRIGENVVFLDN